MAKDDVREWGQCEERKKTDSTLIGKREKERESEIERERERMGKAR